MRLAPLLKTTKEHHQYSCFVYMGYMDVCISFESYSVLDPYQVREPLEYSRASGILDGAKESYEPMTLNKLTGKSQACFFLEANVAATMRGNTIVASA